MRFDLTVNEFTFDLLHKKVLEVYDPNTWRPYCHVKDFARIIFSVLNEEKNKLNFEIFNCGSDENNYRKKDIVELISNKITKTKVIFKSGDISSLITLRGILKNDAVGKSFLIKTSLTAFLIVSQTFRYLLLFFLIFNITVIVQFLPH